MENKSDIFVEVKHLVVLTDGGIYWLLWSLDYIDNLIKLGETVVVVDLSAISLKVGTKRYSSRIKSFYRINDTKNLISSLKNKAGIKMYTPKLRALNKRKYKKSHLNSHIAFRNGLDAEYFEEIGQRVILESLLKRKVLKRAKSVFDFTFGELLEIIEHEKVTKLAVCGGRTLIPSSVIAAGNRAGIDCNILESNDRGRLGYFSYPEKFRRNTTPMQEIIIKNWNSANPSRYEIAQNYLDNKLFKQNSKGINFAINFVYNDLVDELREASYVVFFLTSDFEFLLFPGEEEFGDFSKRDQVEKVREFCTIAIEYGYTPIVRGHPQRSGRKELSAIDDPEWSQLCDEIGVMYISTQNNTSSYELM